MMAGPAAQQVAGTDGELFCEDFSTGQVWEFGCRELSREDIIGFARRYDPQPFHIDEHAARSTMLKGLAASGWHVCTIFMGMFEDGLLSRCRSARIFAIDEIKWRMPVRPGDQLRCRITCMETVNHASRPGYGICTLYCECLNTGGHMVMSWRLQLELRSARAVGLFHAGARIDRETRGSRVTLRPGSHAITFFEDVRLGNQIILDSYTFNAGSIVEFNKHYGPQLIHPDAAPDHQSASGWHVTAIWMQRLVRYYMREAERSRAVGRRVPQLGPSPGIRNLRWHRPAYAGDRLTFTCWAERKVAVQSRPDWGLLISGIEIRNQRSECVASFYALLLLERREKKPDTRCTLAQVRGKR